MNDKLLAHSFNSLIRLVLGAFLLVLINACAEQVPSKLEQIKQRGSLKVVTRNSPTTYYENADGYAGVEYELASQFAAFLGVDIEFIVTDNLKEISRLIHSGEADFAAAGLSITSERQKNLRFAPSYQRITSKLVFKQGKKWPRNITQLDGELRVVAHSTYSQELLQLKTSTPELHWSETSEQTAEELLMMVLEETIDYTIVDSSELQLNRRFHPELAVAFTLGKPQNLAWGFPKTDDYSLFSRTIEFFGTLNAKGKIAQLQEKYYGHIENFDYVGARHFHRATEKKLDQYKPWFVESAGDDLDWRLLAAVSYQESHWKPNAKSPTGVRGMMMLTLNTAKQVGIKNRLDAEQSIRGGALYLRKVISRVPKRIAEPDKTWFALAGYNVGWGHVEDARIITQRQGADPDKWSDVKERLPLLQKKKWYKQTKHGYARGAEPVRYVNNIRRYYDVLVWQDEEIDLPLPSDPQLTEKKEQDSLVASQ